MEVLILAALIGLIPAAIAKNKGRSFGLWWLYGAALFIVALPHALLARTLNEGVERHQREAGLTKCPYCAEFVKGEAVVCKHCGHALLLKSEFAPEVHAHPALAGIDNRSGLSESLIPTPSTGDPEPVRPVHKIQTMPSGTSFGRRGT